MLDRNNRTPIQLIAEAAEAARREWEAAEAARRTAAAASNDGEAAQLAADEAAAAANRAITAMEKAAVIESRTAATDEDYAAIQRYLAQATDAAQMAQRCAAIARESAHFYRGRTPKTAAQLAAEAAAAEEAAAPAFAVMRDNLLRDYDTSIIFTGNFFACQKELDTQKNNYQASGYTVAATRENAYRFDHPSGTVSEEFYIDEVMTDEEPQAAPAADLVAAMVAAGSNETMEEYDAAAARDDAAILAAAQIIIARQYGIKATRYQGIILYTPTPEEIEAANLELWSADPNFDTFLLIAKELINEAAGSAIFATYGAPTDTPTMIAAYFADKARQYRLEADDARDTQQDAIDDSDAATLAREAEQAAEAAEEAAAAAQVIAERAGSREAAAEAQRAAEEAAAARGLAAAAKAATEAGSAEEPITAAMVAHFYEYQEGSPAATSADDNRGPLADAASVAALIDQPRQRSADAMIATAYYEAEQAHASALELAALAERNPGLHSYEAESARRLSREAAAAALGTIIWSYLGNLDSVATSRNAAANIRLKIIALVSAAYTKQRDHEKELSSLPAAMVATPYPHKAAHIEAARLHAYNDILQANSHKERARLAAKRLAENVLLNRSYYARQDYATVIEQAAAAAEAAYNARFSALVLLSELGYTRTAAAPLVEEAAAEAADHDMIAQQTARRAAHMLDALGIN